MNVNATNATFSIVLLLQPSALLLPAQIHTLYVTPYETRSMRELAALRMVLGRRPVGGLDGEDGAWRWRYYMYYVSNVVREEGTGGRAGRCVSK